MKPPYNLEIQFHDVGATVQVGCKSLAYSDCQQMLIDLGAYVNDPETTMKLMQEQHPGLKRDERIYRTAGIPRNPFMQDEVAMAGEPDRAVDPSLS